MAVLPCAAAPALEPHCATWRSHGIEAVVTAEPAQKPQLIRTSRERCLAYVATLPSVAEHCGPTSSVASRPTPVALEHGEPQSFLKRNQHPRRHSRDAQLVCLNRLWAEPTRTFR